MNNVDNNYYSLIQYLKLSNKQIITYVSVNVHDLYGHSTFTVLGTI